MRFFELVKHTPTLSLSGIDSEVSRLSLDSREAGYGDVLFCLAGKRLDRHDFAAEAYRNGCRAFVAEKPLSLPPDAAVATVPNARIALAELSSYLSGAPTEALFCIAVTGGKEKTNTAWLLTKTLERLGVPVGYIGAFGAYSNGKFISTSLVTPESNELQGLLREMRVSGVTHAVIEVSAPALAAERVYGIRFPLCILAKLNGGEALITSGTPPKEYLMLEKAFFRDHHAKAVVYPDGDSIAEALLSDVGARLVSVGKSLFSSVCAHAVEPYCENQRRGIRFHAVADGEVTRISLPVSSDSAVREALLTVAAVRSLVELRRLPAVSLSDVGKAIESVEFPKQKQRLSPFVHTKAEEKSGRKHKIPVASKKKQKTF